MLERLKALVLKHTIAIVVLYILTISSLFMLGAQTYKTWFYNQLTRDVAHIYATTLDSLHRFYAEQIVPRAVSSGMTLSTEFQHNPNTLPWPITFSTAFGKQLQGDMNGLSVDIYSNYPFPGNKDRTLSPEARKILYALENSPHEEVIQVIPGHAGKYDLLKLARPITMETSCLGCHNDPFWKLGRTWQQGDFRGVREITIPMLSQPQLTEGMLPLAIALAVLAAISGGILILPLVQHLKRTLKHSEQLRTELAHLSRHDALTGAANPSWFREQLHNILATRHGNDDKVGLIFLDIDDFKNINDSLGHLTGDLVLKTLSARVSAQLSGQDILARVGGDEFVIVKDNPQDKTEMTELANRVLAQVNAPIVHDGHTIEASVSVGVTLQSKKTACEKQLLEHADSAMYTAKSSGKNTLAVAEHASE